jgi:5-methylcytosine-specific restriction protein A
VNRIRGRKLQDIRKRHFEKHPLCVHCEAKGRVRLATELDHITPIAKGGRDDGPKQGLCSDCHKAKTAQDMGYINRQPVGLDGWHEGGGSNV